MGANLVQSVVERLGLRETRVKRKDGCKYWSWDQRHRGVTSKRSWRIENLTKARENTWKVRRIKDRIRSETKGDSRD